MKVVTQTTANGQTTTATHTLDFSYDASGSPMAVTYDGTTYYYALNLQGDVLAILDGSGNRAVSYTYDAWGYEKSCTGTMASTLGHYNPLRYRGYVYDTETKLYYLQSRYYNPGLGRFINADAFTSTGQGILGNNMFAYCLNNPVNYADREGKNGIPAVLPAVPLAALPFLDGPIPVGDIIVVIIVLLGIARANEESTPEVKYDSADQTYESPSPNRNNDDDDDDDYYDDESNFGGRQKVGKNKGNTPGSNKAQNKQFRDATRELSKDQQRALHDEISGEGLSFHDIVDMAKNLWIFLVGIFASDDS